MNRKITDEDMERVFGEIAKSFLPLTQEEVAGIRDYLQRHDSYCESVEISTKRSLELGGIKFDGYAVYDPEERDVITEKWDYGGDGYSFSLAMNLMAVFSKGGMEEEDAENLGRSCSMSFLDAATKTVKDADIPPLTLWVVPGDAGLVDVVGDCREEVGEEDWSMSRLWIAPMLNTILTDRLKWTVILDLDHEPNIRQGLHRYKTEKPTWRSKGGSLICFDPMTGGEREHIEHELTTFFSSEVLDWHEQRVAPKLKVVSDEFPGEPERVAEYERTLRRKWLENIELPVVTDWNV